MSAIFFWDWLGKSQRPFPWSLAAVVAFAILCKFSWLFLLPALPLITLVYDMLSWQRTRNQGDDNALAAGARGSSCRDAGRLILSFSLTVLMINWCYGFEGTGTPLGDFEFVSESLTGSETRRGEIGNRFSKGPISWAPVPLPREMVGGIDYLKWEFEGGMQCYLRGRWQHGGWWYFHVYAMSIKIPLGYWILIGVGSASLMWHGFRRGTRRPLEWLPIVFAALFVGLVSSQTGFTHHVRYVLPAYGFLFVVASRVTVILPHRMAMGLAVICMSGTVWFHATHLGLAHTYFSPIVGGPNNGWRHLGFSNADWGQSTYRMADWVKAHPEQRPMTVLFRSGLGSPEQLVSEMTNVATVAAPSRSGWFLISSFQMTLAQNKYFWDKAPVAQPCPDMLLFHISEDQP